ncbi:peptidase family C78-domain-containing protein [Fennellomyces sp. T-0311]|nr:peptidase family C78-domain-containing protein [Fennellomyces sp. T-0311]
MDEHLAEQLENEELLLRIQQEQQPRNSPGTLKRQRTGSAEIAKPPAKTIGGKTIFDIDDYARTNVNQNLEIWKRALPRNDRVADILLQLATEFRKSNQKRESTVYLGSARTDLIISDFWDKGWSCGYRNCQMLMSFLEKTMEMDDKIIKHVIDISGLQRLLERAWQEGFDPVGASQLKGRVFNTRKWIGTTEVYAMLVYLGVRCTILDFDLPKDASQQQLTDCLFDCIQTYFEDAVVEVPSSKTADTAFDRMMKASMRNGKTVYNTNKPPLYLQHAGHSRTVVGIELLRDGKRNLVVFDPGRRAQRGKLNDTGETNPYRLPAAVSSLQSYRVDAKAIERNSQYQLLVLGGAILDHAGRVHWQTSDHFLLTEWERDRMKKIASIRVI